MLNPPISFHFYLTRGNDGVQRFIDIEYDRRRTSNRTVVYVDKLNIIMNYSLTWPNATGYRQ